MVQLRIVMLLATMIVLAAGCATERTGAIASLAVSDAPPATIASGLRGTWRGWFVQTGSDGHVEGDMTLVIKDDATYRLISIRRGRGDVGGTASKESGVVVAEGRTVTLKSATGQWTRLVHKGDSLYGMVKASSGHTLQISVERTSAVPTESP